MTPFILNPKLALDTEFICHLPLSEVRLNQNGAFPWILLIPRRANKIEIIDLDEDDQLTLLYEIRQASQIMQTQFQAKKLNIANLGNIVSQLHIHIIARYETDPAWPHPVWNTVIKPYTIEEKQRTIQALVYAFRPFIKD